MEKKCPSCLAGFSREDINGNCTCGSTPTTESATVNVCPIHNNTHYCAYKIQVGKCECVCTCAESAADGGWEEQFDDKIGNRGRLEHDYYTQNKIKSFISDLLRKEREAVEKECEKCAADNREEGAKAERERILAALPKGRINDATGIPAAYARGYNKAIRKMETNIRRIIQSPPTSQNEGV